MLIGPGGDGVRAEYSTIRVRIGKPLITIPRAFAACRGMARCTPILLRPSPDTSIFNWRPSNAFSAIIRTPKSMASPIPVKTRFGSRSAFSTLAANAKTLAGSFSRCQGIMYCSLTSELHWKSVTATPSCCPIRLTISGVRKALAIPFIKRPNSKPSMLIEVSTAKTSSIDIGVFARAPSIGRSATAAQTAIAAFERNCTRNVEPVLSRIIYRQI